MAGGRTAVAGLGFLTLLMALAAGCNDKIPHETRNRPGGATPPDDEGATRVLFIGNSHVFTMRMPDVVAKLAEAEGIKLRTSMQAPGGVQLGQHAQSQATLGELRSGKYDWVILQEASNLPYGQPTYEQFSQAVDTLAAAARKANPNVRVALYMVHAHDNAGTFQTISKYYTDAAAKADALVIPVADAYERVRKSHPQMKLTADGNHFNASGCYLTACTIYAAITKRSPIGMPHEIGMIKLNEADAKVLQVAALDAVEAFQKAKPKPPNTGPRPSVPAATKANGG